MGGHSAVNAGATGHSRETFDLFIGVPFQIAHRTAHIDGTDGWYGGCQSVKTGRKDEGSCMIFCFVAVSVLGASYVCNAADAPSGSYKKTCTSIYYNESSDRITSASCKKMSGSSNTTQLYNCNQCTNNGGDIENCDGTLQCSNVGIPTAGSYKASCFCCKMTGTTLSCYCKNKKGKAGLTTLGNASSCSSPWNDNEH